MDRDNLSLAAMQRILKQAGAERVSNEAQEVLRKAVEEYAAQLSEHAVELAEHANRKTIQADDIELAQKS